MIRTTTSHTNVTDDIKKAELLVTNCPEKFKNREEKIQYQNNVSTAIDIYKRLCLNFTTPIFERLRAICSFINYIPDEGLDMLSRWRDSLNILRKKDLEDMVNLLVKITREPLVCSKERLITAVTLYNQGYIEVCYACFVNIAADTTILIEDRVASCRYLFASEQKENRELAQKFLTHIIDTDAYPSSYRYNIIAAYIIKTGFALSLNMTKVRIDYDERFVYGLQHVFFNNNKNGIRERILSAQHMLSMACVEKEEKIKICEVLLEVAGNQTYDENVRADAADVVLRMGYDEQIRSAREKIVQLGMAVVDTSSTTLCSRAKTVYSNRQNVHDEKISECIGKAIEKFSKETHIHLRPFPDVYQEVVELVRSFNLSPTKQFFALKALNRIGIDTATFTEQRITIAEIFIHVWTRICKYESEKRETLERFLVDELIDMGDTCSSGHAGRLVNVLASEDGSLRISFESQIVANIAGRLTAKIRTLTDDALKDSITMGMLEDAEKEDKDTLQKFLDDNKADLYAELSLEFIGGGYVTRQDFDTIFERGYKQWL